MGFLNLSFAHRPLRTLSAVRHRDVPQAANDDSGGSYRRFLLTGIFAIAVNRMRTNTKVTPSFEFVT